MLAAKIDLLLKRLEERVQDKEAMKGTVQALYSHKTCEVCGNVAIRGMIALEPAKKLLSSTMGFANQKVITGGITNPARKVIRTSIRINENITKKLMYNDKMLENINSKIESLTSSVKNHLSFNKMIET